MRFLRDQSRLRISMPLVLSWMLTLVFATAAIANNDNGTNNNGTNTGGNNVTIGQPIAGVDVDANGVLKMRVVDPRLARQRLMQALRAAEVEDVMKRSELRKVSLNRLEKVIDEHIQSDRPLSDDMLAVAGLTSVQYVFYYPDTQDIVIAGPAEGFVADPTDRFVGIHTGRPTILLEDLATALRAYAPATPPTRVISVSIDPTPEGLARMQKFLRAMGGQANPGDTMRLVQGLKQNLGLQTVTIEGIPAATHFARVLVEADYRMKLIGIGLEQLPVPVRSYVSRTSPQTVAANSMERWYFQPNYDGVSVSEDHLAMRINERGVQLVGEGERVMGNGQRVTAGRTNRASQAFTKEFTDKYPLIASRVRVYAELQQLIDLAIAAAYIQEQDFYAQADWTMPVLGDEAKLPVETYTAPEQVETAVNAIWRGNTLMTPLGGGVSVQPRVALNSEHMEVDETGDNEKMMNTAGPKNLQSGQWWWD
ncbi:DUF1598 domain-containing protein [Allorhodopirellula heiligendammensis]|uniref:DUF1598 domain-containing protein n=1 Tax=Allorhodopirellula heiligendammensis TaxID=2714739 RepID=A0A5C6BVR4_9BACT|nr:DUF1598 domain-containing protein [Allorhodopirellula heiligendammensis]TWU15316.1 hypothetical protein Poly21_25110 [Allorhodopirellula heiligendammensis]